MQKAHIGARPLALSNFYLFSIAYSFFMDVLDPLICPVHHIPRWARGAVPELRSDWSFVYAIRGRVAGDMITPTAPACLIAFTWSSMVRRYGCVPFQAHLAGQIFHQLQFSEAWLSLVVARPRRFSLALCERTIERK